MCNNIPVRSIAQSRTICTTRHAGNLVISKFHDDAVELNQHGPLEESMDMLMTCPKILLSQIPTHPVQKALHGFDLRRRDPLIGLIEKLPGQTRHLFPCGGCFSRWHQSFYTTVCWIALTGHPPVPFHSIYKSDTGSWLERKVSGKLGLRHWTQGKQLAKGNELGRTNPGTFEFSLQGTDEGPMC